MTSLLSVHGVQFEKGVYNSSDTFLANLIPNTAAMISNLETDIAFVGSTFHFRCNKSHSHFIIFFISCKCQQRRVYHSMDKCATNGVLSSTIAPWNSDSGKFW